VQSSAPSELGTFQDYTQRHLPLMVERSLENIIEQRFGELQSDFNFGDFQDLAAIAGRLGDWFTSEGNLSVFPQSLLKSKLILDVDIDEQDISKGATRTIFTSSDTTEVSPGQNHSISVYSKDNCFAKVKPEELLDKWLRTRSVNRNPTPDKRLKPMLGKPVKERQKDPKDLRSILETHLIPNVEQSKVLTQLEEWTRPEVIHLPSRTNARYCNRFQTTVTCSKRQNLGS
jgi:hypothetical protein